MRFAVLLLAAALPGALPADEPPIPGESLFPLAIGNTWTYRVASQFPQEDRFVVRVAGNEMIGEQTCFLLEAKLKDRVVATEHVAFTKNGLTRFRADKEDIVPPVTFLKVSATAKDDWNSDYQLGERKASAAFSRDIGFIAVGTRRYRGATVVTGEMGGENGSRVKSTAWYASGVGMVRQQIDEGKRQTTLELEKFQKGE